MGVLIGYALLSDDQKAKFNTMASEGFSSRLAR
jgi:hypothetical protein